MLVVAGPAELAEARRRIWGTGGWDPPETREARDWLCLGRLCGWNVTVTGGPTGPASRFVVWTGEAPRERPCAQIAARLEREPLLVVLPAARAGSACARLAGAAVGEPVTGSELVLGASAWTCRVPLDGRALACSESEPLVTLDRRVVAAVRPYGRGSVVTLGLHPSRARDADGAATALLRELLLGNACAPVDCLDWSGTLVLRMDDPGSPESAYRDGWRYPKLDRDAWQRIGEVLRARDACLSAAYVPAFVDEAGAVHPSHAVRRDGWDGVSEHAGLTEQRALGTVEVELHGWTHMHPDRAAWAAAPDRFSSERWYRELVPAADALPPSEHPLARGVESIEAAFGTRPRALVCPGDAWTQDSLVRALDLGLELVSSYYLALRDRDRWVWCQHVCAPYLDTPDGRWFDAGVPVVGYFHDMEPSVHGIDWLVEQLDAWAAAGARRMIDLRTLAVALRHSSAASSSPSIWAR